MQFLKNFKFLKPYIKDQKKNILIMLLALTISSSSILAFGKYIHYAIDNISIHSAKSDFLYYFIVQNSLILILAIGTALRYYFTSSIGEKIVLGIKKDLFSHLMKFSPSYFESKKIGEVISLIQNDTMVIQNFMGSNLSVALRNIIMFCGSATMLLMSSQKLTLLIILLIPLVIIPIIILGKKLKSISRQIQDQQCNLTSICEESISTIKILQSYCKENLQINTYSKNLTYTKNLEMKFAKIKGLLIFIIIFLIFFGIGMILWYGGYEVMNGKMSVGELSSFVFLSIICAGAISSLSETLSHTIKTSTACEKAASFLNLKSDIIETTNAHSIKNVNLETIEFKNINFSYPAKKDEHVLNNINLVFNKGEKIAIVGKSGAGKSTFFQLLMRFYEPQNGEISFNNIGIKEIKINELRSKFAYIPQEPVIFSSTIYDNILIGNPKASYEEILEISKLCAVDEFAQKLDDKHNTFIGEKGVRLSSGQKQRICIARAILSDADVFLFDEATSYLDYKNELMIKNNLKEILKDKLTITIAHRLSTITDSDKIIIVNDGIIVESGTHESLISNNDVYSKLFSAGIK
ncbi:MAG: ATP-binding cassette subfamily B protein [Candidatus Midichloriaceae bacterium]|jgi:ATP-binding cassette subfamily B protein